MFVFNFKIKAKKTVILAAVLSVTAAIICTAVTVAINSRLPDTAVSDKTGEYSLALNDGEEKKFLEQFGVETADAKPEKRSVVIPSDFNKYYEEYNELQKKIGLDLAKFKGKEVTEIIVPLEKPKDNNAVLLVYKNRVIGGHITNGEYGSKNLPLVD